MSTADQAKLFNIEFDDRVITETDQQREERIKAMLKQIGSLVGAALQQIRQAGLIVVRLLDEDGLSPEELAEKSGVQKAILNRLEQVGRQKLHPSLYLGEKRYSAALAKMPYPVQKNLLEENGALEVLVGDGDVLKVRVEALEPIQIKQVFSSSRVRTVAEQRAWLESQKTIASIKTTDASKTGVSYEVIGGKLVVHVPQHFSLKTLERIVSQMKAARNPQTV